MPQLRSSAFFSRAALAALPIFVFTLAAPAQAQISNYLALGDSYAFGYTTADETVPSFGDQGYVAPFADYLATRNGGVRPLVTNFAVPGETSTSFSTGAPLPNGKLLNLNYAPTYSDTQNAKLSQYFAQQQAQGLPVNTITVQLGGNDFLNVLGAPGFGQLTPFQQQALLGSTFNTLQTNYTTLLTTLRTAAPQADLFILGYPDPFAGLGAANPLAGLSTPLTLQANALYASLASAFGARYVDIYTPFVGNELRYTYISTGNFHPNATGYNVIAQQLVATASAPEPGSMALLATMAIPVAGVVCRRKKAKA